MTTKITDDVIYGRHALRENVPWIVPESLDFLRGIIQPDWSVWEWGSGGSTVYWARNCKFTISVEHNSKWFHWTRKQLIKDGLWDNVRLINVPGDQKEDKSRFRYYADVINDYVRMRDAFDLVFVDGEASSRGWCVGNAVKYLRPGGWLLLDNGNWYKDGHTPSWERTDFVAKDLKWVGQPGTFDWWTSILRKPVEQT